MTAGIQALQAGRQYFDDPQARELARYLQASGKTMPPEVAGGGPQVAPYTSAPAAKQVAYGPDIVTQEDYDRARRDAGVDAWHADADKQWQQNPPVTDPTVSAREPGTWENATAAVRGDDPRAEGLPQRARNWTADRMQEIGTGAQTAYEASPLASLHDLYEGVTQNKGSKVAMAMAGLIPGAGPEVRAAERAAARSVPTAAERAAERMVTSTQNPIIPTPAQALPELARTYSPKSADEGRLMTAAETAEVRQNFKPLDDLRVSGRYPTAQKGAIGEGRTQDLPVDVASARQDPEYFEKATSSTGPMSLFLPHKILGSSDPEVKALAAEQHMMKNFDAIYSRMDPEVIRRSQLWYPGGRKIAEQMAKDYGIPVQSAAAMLATLSPETEWFANIDRANRTARALHEDPTITRQMIDHFKQNASPGLLKPDYLKRLEDNVGKKISEVDDATAAHAVVAHDYTKHWMDRTYQKWSPEGAQLGPVKSEVTGNPNKAYFKQYGTVENAVRAYRSGGDLDKIGHTTVLGARNKVRNFYNDIVAPDRTGGRGDFPDITVDTHHAGAATLSPVGAADLVPVSMLGGSAPKGAPAGLIPGSSRLGTSGLYPFVADATRKYAKEQGIAPSMMQSPVWEGVRSIFPDTWKTPANKEKANKIWEAHRKGEISQDQAIKAIFTLAPRGPNITPWNQ